MHLGKAVTTKPKKIENRDWSYFVALEKFFLTVIRFLIFKFFPNEAIANQSEMVGMIKIHHTVVHLGKAVIPK